MLFCTFHCCFLFWNETRPIYCLDALTFDPGNSRSDIEVDLKAVANVDIICLSLFPSFLPTSLYLAIFFPPHPLPLFPPLCLHRRVTGWTGRRWSVRFWLFPTTAVRVSFWLETLWSAPFPTNCRPPPPRSCRWRWDTHAVCFIVCIKSKKGRFVLWFLSSTLWSVLNC